MKLIENPRALSIVTGDIEIRIGEIDQLAMLAQNNTDDLVSMDVLLKAIRRTCIELCAVHHELLSIASTQLQETRS